MKRIIAVFLAIACVGVCQSVAFADALQEKSVDVLVNCIQESAHTQTPVDENGNAEITLPNDSTVSVSGAQGTGIQLIVEQIDESEEEAYSWFRDLLGGKPKRLIPFYIALVDADGKVHSPKGSTITVTLPQEYEKLAVYFVKDGQAEEISCTVSDGRVTLTAADSCYYMFCEKDKTLPTGTYSPKTGDERAIVPALALLAISGGVLCFARRGRSAR